MGHMWWCVDAFRIAVLWRSRLLAFRPMASLGVCESTTVARVLERSGPPSDRSRFTPRLQLRSMSAMYIFGRKQLLYPERWADLISLPESINYVAVSEERGSLTSHPQFRRHASCDSPPLPTSRPALPLWGRAVLRYRETDVCPR